MSDGVELPEWPGPKWKIKGYSHPEVFEETAYWESRCRLAVEALEYAICQFRHPHLWAPQSNHWSAVVGNAIGKIGQLPPKDR